VVNDQGGEDDSTATISVNGSTVESRALIHPDNPEVNIIKAVRISKGAVPLILSAPNITPMGLVLVSLGLGPIA
ncbi:MAG TPA: hypothetical protein DHW01_03555, partial [Rhodobacter sp.]|nr:hypothetical protein [Rhodobacter sp.]